MTPLPRVVRCQLNETEEFPDTGLLVLKSGTVLGRPEEVGHPNSIL